MLLTKRLHRIHCCTQDLGFKGTVFGSHEREQVRGAGVNSLKLVRVVAAYRLHLRMTLVTA